MHKKMYRSKTNKMILGVCGGIAEHFEIDPTLVRLAFALFGCTGSGILFYFAAAFIMPDRKSF